MPDAGPQPEYALSGRVETAAQCRDCGTLVEPVAQKLAVGEEHFRLDHMSGTFIHAFVGRDSRADAEFQDGDGSRLRLPMVADVQGAEFEMMLGAARALHARRIGYLFISAHGCEHHRCLKHLRGLGYEILASHTIVESFSGDGLIAARSPDRPGPGRVEISRRATPLWQSWRYRLACLGRRLARPGA